VAAKILLLDSNARLLTTMSERLTYLGYEVSTASRVHDAVLKGIVVPPDLLVCDVMMPELNGWEVKRLVAHIPSLAETPVLFLSAHNALPTEFYEPMVGLVEALKKSLVADALATAVTSLLARQAARSRLMAHPMRGALPMTDASLLDLCQVLARRSATGVLRLTSPGWSAELIWINGVLVDASTDALQGNEAVYAALAGPPADLHVTIDPPAAVPPQRRVSKPLPDLLAEVVRRTRGAGDSELSQPDARPAVESDEDFLARLAATGLIRRTAAPTR
jgi:CheY-like chemotaxis protein